MFAPPRDSRTDKQAWKINRGYRWCTSSSISLELYSGRSGGRRRRRRRSSSVSCRIPRARQAGSGNSHNPLLWGVSLRAAEPLCHRVCRAASIFPLSIFHPVSLLSRFLHDHRGPVGPNHSLSFFVFFFLGKEGLTQGWRMSGGGGVEKVL